MCKSLTRFDRYTGYLNMVVAHNREEVSQHYPKRYLVAEYNSGGLNWIYTANSLAECAALIGSPLDASVFVFDLDTGREHRVKYTATVLP